MGQSPKTITLQMQQPPLPEHSILRSMAYLATRELIFRKKSSHLKVSRLRQLLRFDGNSGTGLSRLPSD
jgi:hypothetical protein